MTVRSEVAARAEPRKVHILEVTERLMAEQGFDGLRLRDIATDAKVSIGMIQHYFDTRDALLLEAVSHACWRRAEEWASLGVGVVDPVERTKVLLQGSIADRGRCQAWMETCSASTRHAELSPMIARIYAAWRDALQDSVQGGVDASAFRLVVPLEQVLDSIMAMIDGLMIAVGTQIYDFDRTYVALLMQDIAGRLLQYDFGPLVVGRVG